MAHQIHQDRFVDTRTDAWHKILKHQLVHGETATQAWSIVGEDISFATPCLHVHGKQGQVKLAGYKALCTYQPGTHTDGDAYGDGTLFTHGIVRKDYQEIMHDAFCAIWERATAKTPIETMGLLYSGSTLFVTVKLPSIGIAGDECIPYLVGSNPLDGVTAIRCRNSLVRVVCANTLGMALGGAAQFDFRGIHTSGIADRLETWLRDIWNQQLQMVALMQETGELLARTPCSSAIQIPDTGVHIARVLDSVYPYPEMPVSWKTPESEGLWLKACAGQRAHRTAILDLFDGASTTHTRATEGTLWGAVQSVVEYEDFGRVRRQAHSLALGEGMARKEKALSTALAMVTA